MQPQVSTPHSALSAPDSSFRLRSPRSSCARARRPSGSRSRYRPKTARCNRCPTRARSNGTSRTPPGFSKRSCSSRRSPGIGRFAPQFRVLFNSYYVAVGARHPRPERGMLSRPSLDEVRAYRRHVDAHIAQLLQCRRSRSAMARTARARHQPRTAAPGIDRHRPEAPAARRIRCSPRTSPAGAPAAQLCRRWRGSRFPMAYARSGMPAAAFVSTTRSRATACFSMRVRSRRGR